MKITRRPYTPLPPGEYRAVIIDIEPTTGAFGEQLVWSFDLPEAERYLKAWSGVDLTPRAKLTKWVTALLGQVPEQLETDDLISRDCRVLVADALGADGGTYSRISEVLPAAPPRHARTARDPGPRRPTAPPTEVDLPPEERQRQRIRQAATRAVPPDPPPTSGGYDEDDDDPFG